MAAPTLDVQFSASVQCGVSPLTVNFQDNTLVSGGFARLWFWSFGDGGFSTDQDPTHVYTGEPGSSYDVSLTVVATELALGAISSGTLNATRVSNTRIISGGHLTNDDAWAARSLAPQDDATPEHKIGFNGAQFFYFTNTVELQLKSTVGTEAPVVIETKVDLDLQDLQGQLMIAGFSETPSVQNVWTATGIIPGLTSAAPLETTAEAFPIVQLGDPPVGHNWGIGGSFRTRTYQVNSTTDFGEKDVPGMIHLASAPVAAFSANPQTGPNPMSVQFVNETVESDCGPSTTYEWKKRVSGSGDSFTTFSTSKNPVHTFTK